MHTCSTLRYADEVIELRQDLSGPLAVIIEPIPKYWHIEDAKEKDYVTYDLSNLLDLELLNGKFETNS